MLIVLWKLSSLSEKKECCWEGDSNTGEKEANSKKVQQGEWVEVPNDLK